MAALAQAPTTTRLMLMNGLVLLGVFLFLAVTPAPVTFPENPWETALLIFGAALLLAANVLAVRVGGLTRERPKRGRRANTTSAALMEMHPYEHFHVAAPDGTIGVVAEVIGDRDGQPVGLLVAEGWFPGTHFLVSLDEISRIDDTEQTVFVRESNAPAEQ